MTRFNAVFFDIGETIVDKSRDYAALAEFLGVSTHTFSAVFGGLLARGTDFRHAVSLLRPDLDWPTARAAGAGSTDVVEGDLYPDARPVLGALREAGLFVGICGNQDPGVAESLRRLALPADLVASSAEWDVAKPEAAFFERITTVTDRPPNEIVYVGDQLDDDMLPAQAAGMATVRLRRGPWGALERDASVEARCLATLDSLEGLPDVLLADPAAER